MEPSPELLARAARVLGSAVTGARPVERGTAQAGRWILSVADGTTAFLKAGTTPESAQGLRAESLIYLNLKAPFLPVLRGWDDDGAVPLLLLEDLSAALWPPPWTREPISHFIRTLAEVAATPPPPGLPRLEAMRETLSGWKRIAADPKPFLSLGLVTPAWLDKALPTLLTVESMVLLDGNQLVHANVRSDNICFRGSRAVLVDWNRACVGSARVDLAFWAPGLLAEHGPPPEEVCPGPPEVTALVAGYFAWNAGLPADGVPPGERDNQKVQLAAALPWAARSLGLPPPDGAAPAKAKASADEWLF